MCCVQGPHPLKQGPLQRGVASLQQALTLHFMDQHTGLLRCSFLNRVNPPPGMLRPSGPRGGCRTRRRSSPRLHLYNQQPFRQLRIEKEDKDRRRQARLCSMDQTASPLDGYSVGNTRIPRASLRPSCFQGLIQRISRNHGGGGGGGTSLPLEAIPC